MGRKFDVATFCGSMRYYQRMLALAGEMTARGIICILPHAVVTPDEQKERPDFKAMLDEQHREKILMADYIIVVGSYIGESTNNEIAFAHANNKSVVYKQ